MVQDPHSRDAARLNWIAPLAIGIVPLLTALLVWLGPDAHGVGPDSALSPGPASEAVIERTDQIVLVMWLACAALIAVLVVRGASGRGGDAAPGWRRYVLWGTVPGIALIGAGLLYSRDELGIAARIPPLEIAIGLGIGGVLLLTAAYAIRGRLAANVVLIGVALGLYVPVLLQFPDRLGDLFHARVAFGDLLAVAAGATPLHDFFPLYGLLLGYPVAPIIAAFPSAADTIVTYWVVLLQAITLVTAIATVTWAGGRRYLGAAALIVPALALSGGPPGIGPFTYFQVNPIRTVLPALAIATACWGLSGVRRGHWAVGPAAAGAVAGIAALNNPDFGIGVVVIVVVAAILTASAGTRVRVVALAATGALAPFLLWAVATSIAGVPADWPRYLMFQFLFGPEGYMSIPMTAIGWHVAAVTLFVTAFGLGVLLLARTRTRPASRLARDGLLLTLVGGWSLLTLPYFSGRSLAPTLLGGYALQIGWVTAALLPLVVAGLRRSRAARSTQVSGMGAFSLIAGVMTIGVTAVGILHTSPLSAWDREAHAPVNLAGDQLQVALETAPEAVRAAARDGRAAQIVGIPALTEIAGGLPSASAFSQPDQVTVAPALARAQCEVLRKTDPDYVVVLSSVVPALQGQAACADSFDFGQVILFGTPEPPATQPPLAALPRRVAAP